MQTIFSIKILSDGMRSKVLLFILFFQFAPALEIFAQQEPDTVYTYSIKQSAYLKDKGSIIFIDEAHNNFHTKSGRFSPFSKLLSQDGYQVKSLTDSISQIEAIKKCKILVIANALHSSNSKFEQWALPTPSAFSNEEIKIIKQWVEDGGGLLLIADHMPFAGAAYELGKAFGFEYLNGFAYTGKNNWPPSVFSFKDNTLKKSPIVSGLKDYEKINTVATFTGSAFKIPEKAIPVLSFLNEHYSLQPDTAWSFNSNTPSQTLEGYHQGAVMNFGKGRIAIFGEAAMFTAQIVNGNFKAGINSEAAPQNAQFALNLIHWLDDVKVYSGKSKK